MGCVALCRLPSLARSAPSDSSSGTALAIGGRTWARQIETEVIISGFYFFEKASQEHEHVGNLDLEKLSGSFSKVQPKARARCDEHELPDERGERG